MNTSFEKDEIEELVNEIKCNAEYENKMVLISWGHEIIEDMVKAFGYKHPPEWDHNTFDRAWILEFKDNGGVSTFQDIPQKLLSGDSSY